MSLKKFAGIVAVVMMVVLLFTLVFPFLVQAAVDPDAGDLKVYKYDVVLASGKSVIEKGDTITLTVTFTDPRLTTSSDYTGLKPKATVNTPSFTGSGTPTLESSWLANTFTIVFSIKYNGVGNTFTCDVYYENITNLPMQPVSITLNACQEYTPPAASEPPTVRGTGFVLKALTYGKSDITAGEEFSLKATFIATEGTFAVQNVNVTINLPTAITLSAGAGVAYVGTVEPNKTFTVNFNLIANATAEEGSHPVTLNVSGVNAGTGETASAMADFTVPIVQPERFEISNTMLPDYLSVGMDDGSGYASISLVNKGKGTIYNVSVEVAGAGLMTDEGSQYIGNISPGSETSADFNILATEAGVLNGTIIVTYENSKGEEKTLTHDFTVTAEAFMGGEEPFPFPEEPPPPQGGPLKWIIIAVVLLAVAGGAVTAVILVKKRKVKKAAELEAYLSEDFDEDFNGAQTPDQLPEAPAEAPAAPPEQSK